MSFFSTKWHQLRDWLKHFSLAPSITAEPEELLEENPLENLRLTRHTIRVNLAILEREVTELSAIAQTAIPSPQVTQAKKLLEEAQGALLLDMALSAPSFASSEQLSDTLGQIFQAMNKSTTARHLLDACGRA